jgi:hypothetical protein
MKRTIIVKFIITTLVIVILLIDFVPVLFKNIVVYSFGLNHDTFIWLMDHASEKDTEKLILSLRYMGDTAPDGIMGCYKGHCLSALARASGTNVGLNYSDWTAWYAKEKGREVKSNINITGCKFVPIKVLSAIWFYLHVQRESIFQKNKIK